MKKLVIGAALVVMIALGIAVVGCGGTDATKATPDVPGADDSHQGV